MTDKPSEAMIEAGVSDETLERLIAAVWKHTEICIGEEQISEGQVRTNKQAVKAEMLEALAMEAARIPTPSEDVVAVLGDCAEFLSDIDGALAERCEGALAKLRRRGADAVSLIRERAAQRPSPGLIERQGLTEDAIAYGRALLLAMADDIEQRLASLKPTKDRETDREALLQIADWMLEMSPLNDKDADRLKRIAEGMRDG